MNFGSIEGDPPAAQRYCLTGDTLINTNNGLIAIEDIVKNTKLNSDNNIDILVQSRDNKVQHADCFFNSGQHLIKEMKLVNGTRLKGSYNHPVLTLKDNGEKLPSFEWKTLENIKTGDMVVINRNYNISSDKNLIEIEEARMLGLLLSEGYIHKKLNRIGFNNKDNKLLDEMKGYMEKYFQTYVGKNKMTKPEDSWALTIHSKENLYNWIDKYDLKQYSWNIVVPRVVLQSSLETQKEFLRYLFEGNGSISRKMDKRPNRLPTYLITYTSASRTMLEQIQTMLLQFGIYSSIIKDGHKNREHECYNLSIKGKENIKAFYEKIGFVSERKQGLLKEAYNEYVFRTTMFEVYRADKIPFISNYYRNKYKYNCGHYGFENKRRFQKNEELLKKRLSIEDFVFLKNLHDLNYLYIPVVEIKDAGEEVVYSIRVNSDCHSFVSNGIISHNTEARLESFTEDVFLSELKNDTVPFVPNYDETLKEPSVLPAKLPNLLINGTEGIAVGMAAYAPPHNIGEVADMCIYALQHPKATNTDLLNILQGPDFPTGGIVSNKSDLLDIYTKGTGKIKIRGKMHVEEGKMGKSKLVITEIPYTMIGEGINKFLQSVADLVENKTLSDIIDISNQSSKEGIRLVLELKKGADVEHIKNVLYKKTKLEDTFGMNMLAVWNGRPCTMSLVDIMACYKDFQYEIYEKKFKKLLQKAERQKEIDEGLVKAVDCIDVIIAVLRGSKNTAQVKKCLITGDTTGITLKTATLTKQASKLNFTELQAQAILDMKLQRLIGLELNALKKELDGLIKDITHYNKVLKDKKELTKEIIKELKVLKDKYAVPRKTELIDAGEIIIKEPEKVDQPCYVLIDSNCYIHKIDEGVYEKNKETMSENYPIIIQSSTFSKIIIFTDKGNAHLIKVENVPSGKYKDKGVPIDNISYFKTIGERIIGAFHLDISNQFLFASKNGLVKRTNATEFDISTKKTNCTKLEDKDELIFVQEVQDADVVIYHSEKDMWGKMIASDIPKAGKNAKGCVGVKVKDEDVLKEVLCVDKNVKEMQYGDTSIKLNMVTEVARGTGTLCNRLMTPAQFKKLKEKEELKDKKSARNTRKKEHNESNREVAGENRKKSLKRKL